jgi:hypothetical protein
MSTLGRILLVEDDRNGAELTLAALGEYHLATWDFSGRLLVSRHREP